MTSTSEYSEEEIVKTTKIIHKSLLWRRDFGVANITNESVSTAVLERGSVYSRNRDLDGCKLLVFNLGCYVRGEFPIDNIKKVFVYFLEKLSREEAGKPISILFDCKDAGLKSIDLDFMRFFVTTLEQNYTEFINKIYILSMPWLLNATFKLVRQW